MTQGEHTGRLRGHIARAPSRASQRPPPWTRPPPVREPPATGTPPLPTWSAILLPVRIRRRLAAAAVAVLAATVPVGASAQDLEEVREQRADLENRLEATQLELEEIEARIHQRERELEELHQREQQLRRQIREADAALEIRARAAFKRGGLTTLQALVSGEGPTEAIERAATLDALARRDEVTIESATALRTQLDQVEQLRRDALDEVRELQAELEDRFDELGEDLEDVRILERDLELKAKRQVYIENGFMNGIYSCPIQPPFSFIDSWGFPRSGGRRHKGVDIMAPHRNEVYAFRTGRIARLSQGGLGGISLYLRGDDGNVYFYTHLDGYASGIHVGKSVEAGDLIAYNGNTGNARGGASHIHWEVHPGGGSPVNPYPYAAAACYG